MNKIQRIWQKIAPGFLLVFVRYIMEPASYKEKRIAVLNKFKNIDPGTLPADIREALKYLRYNKFSPFPYKWTHKYDNLLPEVFHDEANNCFFILFEGKKMYFPKPFKEDHVIWAVRSMLKEQDPHSPHLYLTDDFQIDQDSIIIDAGVAEGNFALSVIEKAKKLFLIECEKEWIDALKLTFSPWKDKVIFIEKYMSDQESETTVSIDSLVKPEPGEKYFIKLDIEGFEKKALTGMVKLIASGNNIRMDVCTYHHQEDFNDISEWFNKAGFIWEASPGHVLFFQPGEEPSFRKVLIRAEKK
jgi:hypothetical protein